MDGFLWREVLFCFEPPSFVGRGEGTSISNLVRGFHCTHWRAWPVLPALEKHRGGICVHKRENASAVAQNWSGCAGVNLQEFPWTREKELAWICLNPTQDGSCQKEGHSNIEDMCGVDPQESRSRGDLKAAGYRKAASLTLWDYNCSRPWGTPPQVFRRPPKGKNQC